MSTPRDADLVDLTVLRELVADPRVPVSELAERAGVARNTAQSRLDRLHARGVLGRNDRGVDLVALGFPVSAVIAVDVLHAQIDEVVEALAGNPFVLLVEEVAGSSGDLLVRVVAESNAHLQEVLHTVLRTEGVARTVTSVVLSSRVRWRVGPLLEHLLSD